MLGECEAGSLQESPGEDPRDCGVQLVLVRVCRGGSFSSWEEGARGEPSSRALGHPGLGGPGVGRWGLCTDWAHDEVDGPGDIKENQKQEF